ncbi:MAG TPA: hypothetical protein VKU84_06570 [Stellaceae bacterium]|nr:hypothetical protein [Stellaceae bacterium]
MTWLGEADEDRLFLSVLTLAELRRGIERLEPGGGASASTSGSARSCRSASKVEKRCSSEAPGRIWRDCIGPGELFTGPGYKPGHG